MVAIVEKVCLNAAVRHRGFPLRSSPLDTAIPKASELAVATAVAAVAAVAAVPAVAAVATAAVDRSAALQAENSVEARWFLCLRRTVRPSDRLDPRQLSLRLNGR